MEPQQQYDGLHSIPKTPGKITLVAAVVVVVSLTLVHVRAVRETVLYESDKGESKRWVAFIIFQTVLVVLSLVTEERMGLLFEEIKHRESRDDGRWMKVFKSTFTFTSAGGCISLLILASLLAVFYSLYQNFNSLYRSDHAFLLSLNCFFVPLLLFIVRFRGLIYFVEVPKKNEEENNLNVADGLVWSYYYGYLKLVLPKLEDQICHSMELSHKIVSKKLFILLPKNCYTYGRIEDADPRVVRAGNLKPYELHRAGVHKRSYMHTVYRIEVPRSDGEIEEYHVVLEYPATLITFYDMSNNPESGLSREKRDEQVEHFIRKLKKILDSCPDCKGKYELLPISGERNQIADVVVPKLRDAEADAHK